ncbi:hypothetical protein PENPOL_c040G02011 [Penicillium polonicum]|uniref:Uncharacterized protein n=1 Tax=Penicillium polonicum TaxID=60169 RepID=A0A1V6N5E8_PENPO|nr:hypothetical protein PENPOL_c040G02011 [Penicillium polonicum]
MHAEHADCDRV